MRLKRRGVLAEPRDMLLGDIAGLVYGLATLSSPFCKLLRLVLDLGMETLEDRQDGALERFGRFKMLV
jgi:hypothetical protein